MTVDIHVLKMIVGFVVFLFSVIVHECAHGVTAWHFGDTTAHDAGRITLNPLPHIDPVGSVLLPIAAVVAHVPFIGWAKPVPVNPGNLRNPVTQNAYVAAAGPISNFALALLGALMWIVVAVVYKHFPDLMVSGDRTLMFFNTLCESLITINCVLAVFNLLPIPPLDGHWIFMRFLPPGPREAVASIGRFGFVILILLLWTGVLWTIIGPPFRLVVEGYHALVNAGVHWL